MLPAFFTNRDKFVFWPVSNHRTTWDWSKQSWEDW